MAKTMAETVALIGQQVNAVCQTVDKIDIKVDAIAKAQAATDIHLKSIIGPPSLEDRVNKAMDDKDVHKQSNVMQAITNVQQILTLQQENATLKTEASIGSVAESLKLVAQSVEHTEAMRKENHAAQLEWQKTQEAKNAVEKTEDATWKRGVEKKLNMTLGVIIGVEAAVGVALKYLDFFKH